MAFSDQLAADMAHLMSTDYFGSAATYVDPSGQTTSLTVVLFEESTETPETNGIKTKLRKRECAWAASSLSDVNLLATIKIGTEDWSIAQLVFRDTYQITVLLERHELTQHTRPEFSRR